MRIQLEDANRIKKEWDNKPCPHHIWAKEYYHQTTTGDYRCTICGKEIHENELKNAKTE